MIQTTQRYTGPGYHIWFDAGLWKGGEPARARSRELTPLYLTRYRATRGESRMVLSEGWEFSCIVAGRGELRSSRNVELAPATIYLIPPGIWHAEVSGQMLESIWMGLHGGGLPQAAWDGPRSVKSPEITQLFEKAWFLAQQREACVGPELDGLARAILGGFLRSLEQSQVPEGTQVVEEAIRLMYADFPSPFSVSDLARRLGCSVGYFHRVFRRVAGTSPARYLTRIRLDHAILWLQGSDLPIAEVATKAGFQDPLYFSRAVRKAFGCSPTEVRQQAARAANARRGKRP